MYHLATFVIGVLLALQLAMNGAAGSVVGNYRMANGLFWCIGAATAFLIAATGYESGFWRRLPSVPWWYWAGGFMGGILLCLVAMLIMRMGAASFTAIVLAGQVCGGLLIAHYGLMGTPVEPLTPMRVSGALIMLLGASMAVLGRWPWTS